MEKLIISRKCSSGKKGCVGVGWEVGCVILPNMTTVIRQPPPRFPQTSINLAPRPSVGVSLTHATRARRPPRYTSASRPASRQECVFLFILPSSSSLNAIKLAGHRPGRMCAPGLLKTCKTIDTVAILGACRHGAAMAQWDGRWRHRTLCTVRSSSFPRGRRCFLAV